MQKRLQYLLVVLVMALVGGVISAQNAQLLTHVRVAHLSPDTPAVEVFLNGEPSGIQILRFGDVSGWVELPAGTYSVAVAPLGAGISNAAIGPANIDLQPGAWQTVSAIGSLRAGTLGAAIINEDYSRIDAGDARVTVFHAIEDAPAVDVILPDGTAIVSNLPFGSGVSITVPSAVYNLRVVPSGATSPAVLTFNDLGLGSETFYFVGAIGTLANPSATLEVIGEDIVAPLIGKTFSTATIADIAIADSRFSTLVAALDTAGLVGALQGDGPLTVFAPTNNAFSDLAAALNVGVSDLLALPNLGDILLYHVVPGRVAADDLRTRLTLPTLQGATIRVSGTTLNSSVNIIATDIEASNGIIHVIDSVLLPPN